MLEILAPSTSIFGELNFAIGSGSLTGANNQIVPSSSGLKFNTPTSKAFSLAINGSTAIQFNAITGGSGHFLKQLSAGGAVTSGVIGTSDLGSGTADTTVILRGDQTWAKAVTDTWSIGKELNFTSTSTVTAGNRQIVPTSSGIQYNTSTGTSHAISVNGTQYFGLSNYGISFTGTQASFSSSTIAIYKESSGSGGLTVNVDSTQYLNVSCGNTYLHSLGPGGWLLSGSQTSVGGGQTSIWKDSNGLNFNTVSATNHIFWVNGAITTYVGASLIQLNQANGIYLNSSTGTITSSSRQIAGTSVGLTYNTASGTAHEFKIAGNAILGITTSQVNVATISGINITSSSGSLTGTNREIVGNSAGLYMNTPTGTVNGFSVNGTGYITLSDKGIGFYNTQSAISSSTPNIYFNGSHLVYNVATSGQHLIYINGTQTMNLGAYGLVFVASQSSFSGSTQAIYKSSGLKYNVASGESHVLTVNDLAVATFSSSGLTVTNDPQDYDMFASRKYR